jgi:hypothetical protein
MAMFSSVELDGLEAMERAATQGVWELRFVLDEPRYGVAGVALKQDGEERNFVQISGSGGARSYTEFVYQEKYTTDDSAANGAFIAAIRNAAPLLIAELRAARAALEKAEAFVTEEADRREDGCFEKDGYAWTKYVKPAQECRDALRAAIGHRK